MKKKSNKEEFDTPDYLNFIRRNQQLLQGYDEIEKIQPKCRTINRKIGHPSEVQRYSNAHKQSISETKLKSFKEVIPFLNGNDLDMFPSPRRTDKNSNPEIYTRNFQIPSQAHELEGDESEVKFPKLPNRMSQNYKSISEKTDKSESIELEMEREMIEPRSMKKKINKRVTDRTSEWDYLKKNYAPISVDSRKEEGKNGRAKSMKVTEISKTKLNNKLIRTYYEYENLSQLKDKMYELLPTFKPRQKKRDRIEVVPLSKSPSELAQFLETSKINASKKEAIRSANNKSKKEIAVSPSPSPLIPEEEEDEEERVNYESAKKIAFESQTGGTRKKYNSTTSPGKTSKNNQIIVNNPKSELTVYQNKIASYRQFLFLVNFCHRVFDPLILREDQDFYKQENKYKFYIGKGNNRLLIKSLMKRRFWWAEVDDPKLANFVWTQLKINTYYQFQPKGCVENKFDKLDEHHENPSPRKKKNQFKSKFGKSNESPQKVSGILRGNLPEGQKKIFTHADTFFFQRMYDEALEENPPMKNFSKFESRLKYLPDNFLQRRDLEQIPNLHVHNHFSCNYEIGNKKALFYNLKHYYELIGANPFKTIPLTFHIKKGIQDPEFIKFSKEFKRLKSELSKAEKTHSTKKVSKNVWIIKPGELSNRGNGITVVDEMYEVHSIFKKENKHDNGQEKTFIIQKYIEKPLLYKNRKFDIRHYMMISRLHGRMRAYWFSEGYIRTSCYEYNLEEVGDEMIHLTNDAIQKHCPAYGKYEEGNKLSYAEFQRYLDSAHAEKKYSFIDQIYPRMREIATDAVKSTYLWMDPHESEHNFEVFGLDFMIDSHFNVWLIEVNTNPCLQLSSQLLSRIVPTMVQNCLRLSLDPIFPPPAHYINSIKYLAPDTPIERLQFELIFDQGRDGKAMEEILGKAGKAECGEIDEEDEVYENDGKQFELGGDLE